MSEFARNLENLNPGLFPTPALASDAAARARNRFEGRSLVVGPSQTNAQAQATASAVEQRFTLTSASPTLFVRVQDEGGAAPDFTVELPDGTSYTPQNTQGRDDVGFASDAPSGKTFFAINGAPTGTWTLDLPASGSYEVDVFGANTAPFIELGDLDGTPGPSLEVPYDASDPDDNVEVSLFYDTDQQGQDGVLIEEGLAEDDDSYSWDLSGVSTGTYYVYALATDGKNGPAADYARQPVRVVADGAPSAPTGLEAAPQDTTVELGWNGVPGADTYTLYYNRPGQPLTLANAQTLGVGDTTRFFFDEIAPGRTYQFAVAAVDSSYRQSALSNIVTVEYVSDTENNAPTIAGRQPPLSARVGEGYQHDLSASDPDGDALSYALPIAPAGLNVSGGQLQWTPSDADRGVHRVKVLATDGNGGADSLAYSLTVLDESGARGKLAFSQALYVGYASSGAVTLRDPGLNASAAAVDSQEVQLYSGALPGGQPLQLVETSANSGQFTATFAFGETAGGGALPVQAEDSLRVEYEDASPDELVAATSTFSAEPPTAGVLPIAAGETGTFPLDATGATIVITENNDPDGGQIQFARYDEEPPGSSFDGSSATAPSGMTVTPNTAAGRYWSITSEDLTELTFHVRLSSAGIEGIDILDQPLVLQRGEAGVPWNALATTRNGGVLASSDLTSFSEFTIGGDAEDNPLPVELASFKAAAGGRRAVLTWETASETGNEGFHVERSVGNAGARFEEVGFVEGAGTTAEAQAYRFTDSALPFEAEQLTYRLRQEDRDGKVSYSKEVAVEVGSPSELALRGTSPNPFSSQAAIRYTVPERMHVRLTVYDALGRRVRTLVDGPQEGRQEASFHAENLSSGTYFYRLEAGGRILTGSVVLVR